MPTIYRPLVTQPIPTAAKLVTEDSVTYAVWGSGIRRIRARVNAAGTRCSRRTSRWWIEYRDAGGRRIRRPGYRDRKATEALAAALVRQAERAAVGLDHPGRDPRDRLPTFRELADKYRNHLRGLDRTEQHVTQSRQRLAVILDGLHLADASPGQANGSSLADWLATEKSLRKWSPRNRNLYATTATSFGRWLTTPTGGGYPDPFPKVTRLAEDAGRTIERRALTFDELGRLIAATAGRGVCFGLTGDDRVGLYVIACYTGYRIDEISRLTRGDVELCDKAPVAIRLPAKFSKRRKAERQPWPKEMRTWLNAWLKRRPASGSLWPYRYRTWVAEGADMLREDLAAAEIPHETGGRRVDFHALRVTYVTNLARAGVPLQHAVKLARHSDPKLTAMIYTQVDQELGDQVDRLPGLGCDLVSIPRDVRAKGRALSKPVQQSKAKKAQKGLVLSGHSRG